MDYYKNHLAATGVKACHRLIVQVGANLFQSRSSVLDYGCGTGVLMDLLREGYPHLLLQGAEVSDANIKACAQKGLACKKIEPRVSRGGGI